MGKLTGKVALVTGGSRGIGRAVAAACAREGAKVFIAARGKKDLAAAAEEMRKAGGEVRWLAVDVSRARDVRALMREVSRTYGGLQVLINNASLLGPRVPIAEYPLSQWEEVVRVNLTAVFMVTQEALKIMIPSREGSIINLSSGVGRIGKPRWGAYAASKFGMEGFTQVLAAEVADFKIRVNAVNPGGTRTAMRAEAYPEEDPLTLPTPEEITGVFLYLASGDSEGVTGKSFDAREWLKTCAEP
ncbi:MAG TPA: SDR family NAD(P)-dependent oxidoreductase [Candidatus Binatia bacterium]